MAPRTSFPLHDKFHAGDLIPAYLPVSAPRPAALAEAARAVLARLGHPVSAALVDPIMGPGFARRETLAGDAWPRSTFAHLARSGPVVVCEVAAFPGLTPAALAACQLGVVLAVTEWATREGPLGPA